MVSLGTRLGLAGKALIGHFTEDAARRAGGMLNGVYVGGGDPPKRGTAEYLKAYSTMPWLRAASGKVSRSVASVRWQLFAAQSGGRAAYSPEARKLIADPELRLFRPKERAQKIARLKAAGELREITDHPFLSLMASPNSLFTGLSTRQLTQTYLDIVGEAFLLKERNGLQAPIAWWPIPPAWVKDTPTPNRRNYRVSFRGWNGDVPDTEILWLCDPDPSNPYGRGSGLAQSLGDELETDEFASKFVKSTFYNRARPDMLIMADGLKKEETARMEQDWLQRNTGFWRAFKPMFLNRKVDIHEFGQDFQALQLTQIREYERDTIIQVFGLPPEMLGILTNSNRATIDAADYIMARWVTVPRLEFLRENYQERVIPEYDERLIVDYETPVMEDRELELKVAQAAPWSRDVDEWRDMQGLDPLPDGKGSGVFAVPVSVSFQEMGIPEPPEDIGEGSEEEPDPEPDDLEEEEPTDDPEGDPEVRSGRRRLLPFGIGERANSSAPRVKASEEADRTPIYRIAAKLEPEMRDKFLAAVQRWQGSVSLDRLAAAIRTGQHGDLDRILSLPKVPEYLRETARMIPKALEAGADAAARQIEIDLDVRIRFDLVNPSAVEWSRYRSGALIRGITNETRDEIAKILARASRGEFDASTAARHIRSLIGLHPRWMRAVENYRERLQKAGKLKPDKIQERTERYAAKLLRKRALVIARTELITAANQGQLDLWYHARNEGLFDQTKTKIRWLVAHDDRLDTRICAPMAGQEVSFGESFETPQGHSLEAPPAHPQCRCATRLVFPDVSVRPGAGPKPPKPPKPPTPPTAPTPPPAPAGPPPLPDLERGLTNRLITHPEVANTLSPLARSFFTDPTFQGKYLREMGAEINAASGLHRPALPEEIAARQRRIEELAEILREGHTALGWHAPDRHNGISFKDQNPGIAGTKWPDCRIEIDPRYAAREKPEEVLHTLLHEMIHSRKGYATFDEYHKTPGYEEGLTEASARDLYSRMNLPWLYAGSYDRYVHAYHGVAEAFFIDPSRLLRRTWDGEKGRMREYLPRIIDRERSEQFTPKPPLTPEQTTKLIEILDNLFDRGLMSHDVTAEDVAITIRRELGLGAI